MSTVRGKKKTKLNEKRPTCVMCLCAYDVQCRIQLKQQYLCKRKNDKSIVWTQLYGLLLSLRSKERPCAWGTSTIDNYIPQPSPLHCIQDGPFSMLIYWFHQWGTQICYLPFLPWKRWQIEGIFSATSPDSYRHCSWPFFSACLSRTNCCAPCW